jgi:hypothetical protein
MAGRALLPQVWVCPIVCGERARCRRFVVLCVACGNSLVPVALALLFLVLWRVCGVRLVSLLALVLRLVFAAGRCGTLSLSALACFLRTRRLCLVVM